MAWALLALAGLFEIGWAIGLKYADGFTKPLASALTSLCLIVSLGLLGLALRSIPLGTAYAVWTGIGIVGTAIAGVFFLGEAITFIRLACLGLILAGVVGLKAIST